MKKRNGFQIVETRINRGKPLARITRNKANNNLRLTLNRDVYKEYLCEFDDKEKIKRMNLKNKDIVGIVRMLFQYDSKNKIVGIQLMPESETETNSVIVKYTKGGARVSFSSFVANTDAPINLEHNYDVIDDGDKTFMMIKL